MSGFLSNTPLADMMEIERSQIGQFFSGPVNDIGFTDLTDRLHKEGLDTALNEPSFGPWTSRGRVYGLPHDVHSIMLAYRADLVEAAGIDITQIETWDDFARVMKPMIQDFDGDGQPDRYLLNLWYTNPDSVEMMLLQARGNFF
jgi:arabinosaccharide transport system substrate-binding protein